MMFSEFIRSSHESSGTPLILCVDFIMDWISKYYEIINSIGSIDYLMMKKNSWPHNWNTKCLAVTFQMTFNYSFKNEYMPVNGKFFLNLAMG